ncbi:LexA family transcriptional regulator [Elizabethkingia miricola]|uniref:LexA family transcriptional regulator n=1 Tax=Elizabethkingia miricola TaxID=172045 RepID=UPI003891B972
MNDITVRFLDVYNFLLNLNKTSSGADFAKKIGISVSMMNEILKGRTNAGINPIQKTVIEFPEINPEWLLIGNGEMLRTKSEKKVPNIIEDKNEDINEDKRNVKKMYSKLEIVPSQNSEYEKILRKLKFAEGINIADQGAPFYPLPVSAGNTAELIQEKEEATGFISIPGISCKAYFPVIGFSYEPFIRAGDIIGVDFINKWERLDPDCIYYIITQDSRMLKRLQDDPEDIEKLICISPNFGSFPIWKSEVKVIHKVVFYGRLV